MLHSSGKNSIQKFFFGSDIARICWFVLSLEECRDWEESGFSPESNWAPGLVASMPGKCGISRSSSHTISLLTEQIKITVKLSFVRAWTAPNRRPVRLFASQALDSVRPVNHMLRQHDHLTMSSIRVHQHDVLLVRPTALSRALSNRLLYVHRRQLLRRPIVDAERAKGSARTLSTRRLYRTR